MVWRQEHSRAQVERNLSTRSLARWRGTRARRKRPCRDESSCNQVGKEHANPRPLATGGQIITYGPATPPLRTPLLPSARRCKLNASCELQQSSRKLSRKEAFCSSRLADHRPTSSVWRPRVDRNRNRTTRRSSWTATKWRTVHRGKGKDRLTRSQYPTWWDLWPPCGRSRRWRGCRIS
jgi:hypothetical protein